MRRIHYVPMGFAVALCLLGVSVVFTLFPDALEHAAISFEERGIAHHAWHYTLFAGSAALLYGVMRPDVRIEGVGAALVLGAMTVNLVAIVAAGLGAGPITGAAGGVDVALRVAVILGLGARLLTINKAQRALARL